MSVCQFQIKINKLSLIIGIFILCLQASSAWAGKSYSAKDLYYLAQKSYYQLKNSPDRQQYRHHWEKVIHQFSKVIQRYPKSQQAYKATFTIASLYQGLNSVSKNVKDLNQSLRYYKKVSSDFQKGTLTDDALFESAEIYRNRQNLSAAKGIFKTIFEKHPESDQAGKARLEYKKLVSLSRTTQKKAEPKPAIKKSIVPEKKKKTQPATAVVAEASKKRKILPKPVPPSQEKKITKSAPSKKVVEAKKTRAKVKKVKFKKDKKGGYLYAPSGGVASSSPLIVVDAGHGGKDQGAKSARGLHEKKVNLTIARHVKTILVNRFKYRVVMTRKDDTFIPLKERSAIANNRDADLFVSIHANAAERKSAHGIETYFLGTANNDRALAVAARENGELVHSVKDDQVQEILASLITTTKINDSSRLAGVVQNNLYRSTRKKFRELKNLGVKEGPFYVLHGADMPSILVEVGFLTNRKESRMLSKPDYLYRLASSIAEGIHKYLQDKEPSI